MKLFKKLTVTTGTLAAIVAPMAATVSCGTMKPSEDKGYTLGMAIQPVSSLNYIKYKSSSVIGSTLVEGFAKGGPSNNTAIKDYLRLPHLLLGAARDGGFFIDDAEYQTGVLRRFVGDKSLLIRGISDSNKTTIFAKNSYYGSTEFILNLNGQSKWENDDMVISSNFIDSVVYTLDINTGSQRLNDLFGLRIKGAREFVEAQNAYAKKFGVTYKNPFGYVKNELPANASDELKKVWAYDIQRDDAFPLQLDPSKAVEERAAVDEIENTARNLGIFGDKFSSHPRKTSPTTYEEFSDEDKYVVENVSPYKLLIQPEGNTSAFSFTVNNLLMHQENILPVNRRFIETHGGIDKFGIDSDHFLTEGPFKINDMVLGVNGNILLEKNINYHHASEIIPKSVKLFFQEDPIVSGSLFEDGYISSTKIDSVYTRKFFARKEFRKLIKKNSGFGMTGFTFNLDSETNKNKDLLNPHLRRAMMFALNREEMIKISGFDSTFPSYSLLEPTVAIDHWSAEASGVQYGNSVSNEVIKYSDTFTAPAVPSSTIDGIGMSQLFAHPNQKDRLFNIQEARKEFELFKLETGKRSTTVEFLHDSSPMMVNMALSYKSQLEEAFGGAINLDIKGLPTSIYNSFISNGNFQLTWKNLDYFTHINQNGAGVDLFLVPDGIRKDDMKSIGFIENPTGSWTISNAFNYFENSQLESLAQIKARLGVNTPHLEKTWNKLKELSTIPNIPGLSRDKLELLQRQKVDAFFSKRAVSTDIIDLTDPQYASYTKPDPEFDTTREIMDFVILGNRIIMDQAAVLPIFRVDVSITVDRLPGVAYTKGGMGFSYLYDLMRKPSPDLPGLEVKGT